LQERKKDAEKKKTVSSSLVFVLRKFTVGTVSRQARGQISCTQSIQLSHVCNALSKYLTKIKTVTETTLSQFQTQLIHWAGLVWAGSLGAYCTGSWIGGWRERWYHADSR